MSKSLHFHIIASNPAASAKNSIANEATIRSVENKKTAAAKHDVNATIVSSIQRLVKTATDKANSEGRINLTRADMLHACDMNFCKIWPFCVES